MTRHELEHLIRAAAGNANTTDIVVVGSQAILGTVPEPPAELCRSMEADVFPKDDPGKSIVIDGAIGERSLFHETFGYYAHGVAPETAILPRGAFDRLVRLSNENTRGCTGWCLELHDLAVSKLVAGREKDIEFVSGMMRQKLISPHTVRQRLTLLDNKDQVESGMARFERIVRLTV